MNNETKPWLKNYPEGVKESISFNEYSSLVDMFEKTIEIQRPTASVEEKTNLDLFETKTFH